MKTAKAIAALALLPAVILAAACAGTPSVPGRHPEEVTEPPVCGECHDGGYAALDHGASFHASHRFPATGQRALCAICHADSFCADCHGDKEELKPSDKNLDAPWRTMPHRGDYLNQHKIDGRLDPASCFPCHGRKGDWRCRTCHR